jgi:hypothetical protein
LRAQFRMWKLLLAAGLLALGAEMGVGCGSPDGGICAARCDCERCSNREYDDCLDRADNAARSTDQRGCYRDYDDLLACENDTAICRSNGDFDTNCGPEQDRWQRCIN